MRHSMFILVSDNDNTIERAKSFAEGQGLTLKVYSTSQWETRYMGISPPENINYKNEGGATILPFQPGTNISRTSEKSVCTMNELESVAIKNAIFEFKGNLTEASKALGIGRATLYRKVKQYNIDPAEARRRRAA